MISKRVSIPVLAIAVLLLATAILAACRANSAPGATNTAAAATQQSVNGPEVKIDNFTFGPQDLTVPVGTTVTWINKDDIPHTVVSTDKVFKSKVLDTDDRFSFKFEKTGTYAYFCSIHPKMVGKVIVQ